MTTQTTHLPPPATSLNEKFTEIRTTIAEEYLSAHKIILGLLPFQAAKTARF